MDEFDLLGTDTTEEKPIMNVDDNDESIDQLDPVENVPSTNQNELDEDPVDVAETQQNETSDDEQIQEERTLDELPPTAEEIVSIPNKKIEENSTPVQQFLRRQEETLAAKDAEENRRKEELRQQAKSDLERWYNNRRREMDEKREMMKKDEDALRTSAMEKSVKESCDWSKVIRFLEFSPGPQSTKSKRDLTRMKTCMINAKKQNS